MLETMKSEQKSRVDLEQISRGSDGGVTTNPRSYPRRLDVR